MEDAYCVESVGTMEIERPESSIHVDLKSCGDDYCTQVASTINGPMIENIHITGNKTEDNLHVIDSTTHGGSASLELTTGTSFEFEKAFDGSVTLEPSAGMNFESEKALFSFYQDYAVHLGFSITISSRRRSRTNNTIIAGVYACSRFGYKKRSENKYRPRPTLKTGCKAMIKAKRMENGAWTILEVIKEHNHELDPENVRLHTFTIEEEGSTALTNSGTTEDVGFCGDGEGVEESSLMSESLTMGGYSNSEPFVGMEFESEDAGFSFYSEYARCMGFSIITKSRRRSKTNKDLIAGLYACSKNGFKMPNEKVKFPRPNTRVGCKAMMKVKKLDSGRWTVLDFIKEHNHELNPEGRRFFRSHKAIHTGGKNALRNRCASKVRSNKIYTVLSRQSGRKRRNDSMGKDKKNDADKDQLKFLTVEDVQAIYDYFTHVQLCNPMFLYEVDCDWLQRMRNVFWADAKSRMDCTYFGDVVAFDTTCLTQKNHFPFAPFLGVNHHGQSVLLGSSLILEETPTSFVWVFEAWLTTMSGRSPMVIITNHDRNIKAAVAEVFPNARHCFSLSSILKRAPNKVGPFCRDYEKFIKVFEECIHDSITTDEFERKWRGLMEDFDLTRNKWLQMLYEDRRQWVPVYLKSTNFAGMSTLRQSESLNSFFDTSICSKPSWKEFAEQYESILHYKHEKEALADFETFHTEPSLNTPSPFEKQLAHVYTREIFKKFQAEVLGYSACHATRVQEEGDATIFMVKDLAAKKNFTAKWDSSEAKISCSCGLFEFRGWLCKHAMAVLIASGVYEIPSNHILKRWTKEAKSQFDLHQGCHPLSKVQRFNDLRQKSMKFAEEGSLSERSYSIALSALQEALQKVVHDNENVAGRVSGGGQMQNRGDRSRVSDRQLGMTKEPDDRTKSGTDCENVDLLQEGSCHQDVLGDESQSDGSVRFGGSCLANQPLTQENLPEMLQLDLRMPEIPSQCAPRGNFQLMEPLGMDVWAFANQSGMQDSITNS